MNTHQKYAPEIRTILTGIENALQADPEITTIQWWDGGLKYGLPAMQAEA